MTGIASPVFPNRLYRMSLYRIVTRPAQPLIRPVLL